MLYKGVVNVRRARTLSSSKIGHTPLRFARVLTGVVLLLAPSGAAARETPALHEEDDPEDLADIEEEAFGTRGLVRTRAETVSFDAKVRSIELSGNVRVDAPPFHLRSQHIKLSRTKYGIEADGKGTLAFCPCLGTPVTIDFEKAIVAPPGELILKAPKLEIYGVPVLYLPWFWLRSDEKVGLLPPDIAYRGQDGFFFGGGAHLPWKDRGSRHTLDVRGGAYLEGGFATDVRLRSPTATTKIRFDRLPGAQAPALPASGSAATNGDDGLLVDARGASHPEGATVAWDVDVLRGRRGVAATTDLDAAAKPWDRASASGAVRLGPLWFESGFRAVTRRGGDLVAVEASGPFTAVRSSGALASGVTYDVTVEGGAVRASGRAASFAAARESLTPETVSYGRAEVGALAATTFGPLGASVAARGAGDVAAEGRSSGGDRAATARLRLNMPLARRFGDRPTSDADPYESNDPVVHVIDPFVEASVLHARGNGILGSLPGRGLASLSGTAPVADAGVTSTIGRWGRREALEVTAAGGAAYGSNATRSGVRPLARGRLSATFAWLGAQVETAHVLGGGASGNAVVGRVRLGRDDGLRMLVNVASREGLDPVLARALTEATLESPGGFLAREGTTAGAGLVVPWTRAITTSGGVDADATNRELVAARAGIELRDRCNCVTLRVNGSQRIGRNGVDVWLALDFAAGH